MRFPTIPLPRRGTSRAADEVDRHGNAVKAEPLTQLVLDPVAVVARDQRLIVYEDAEAWRPFADLRRVEHVQPLAVLRRRLPLVAEVGERLVQLRRRHLGDVAVEELLDRVEQPVEAATGLCRDGDERRTLPQS